MPRTTAAVVLAILVAIVVSAHATVLVPATLADLAREARTVVRGRVVAAEGRWADDHRRIETAVTLRVDSTLKGVPETTLQFTVPGGRFGRYRSIVLGAPQFVADQQVIVFLSGAPSARYVLGWSQGVFRVLETNTGPMVVIPGAVAAISDGLTVPSGARAQPAMALNDFERQVRAIGASR
jgi:hypothetical protein